MTANPMQQEQRLDEELALFIDAFIETQATPEGLHRPSQAETVELLARVLAPQSPPTSLQRRLAHLVRSEWDHPRAAPARWAGALLRSRERWGLAVAATLALVAAAVALTAPVTGDGLAGTAGAGQPSLLPLAIALVLVGSAALAAWLALSR